MYGSYSIPSNCRCSLLNILYSMLIGVSAVKGLTRVKKMSDASLCIWRLWAVVTVRRLDHFFLKFRTSRRKIVFSAVNSRDAVHSIRESILCSMLNSRACMEAFGLISLERTACVDFCEVAEGVDVRDRESESVDGAIESRRLIGDLLASRRGIMMSTCWQTMREGMNLLTGLVLVPKFCGRIALAGIYHAK